MEQIGQFFNSFLDKSYNFLTHVLPRSPFQAYLRGYEDGGSGILSAINYFVPIESFIAITETWVMIMFLYYLYHGLISKIWLSNDKINIKSTTGTIGKIVNVFKGLFRKI